MEVFSWERISGFRNIVFPLPTILTSFRYQACPLLVLALLSRARHYNASRHWAERKKFFETESRHLEIVATRVLSRIE